MTLNEEQIRKDDEMWGYLDVIKELKYSGLEVKHRLNITNYDLHYHAWLHRASLNRLQEYAPVVHGHWIAITADVYRCSNCDQLVRTKDIVPYCFCNVCGAKMDEKTGGEKCE